MKLTPEELLLREWLKCLSNILQSKHEITDLEEEEGRKEKNEFLRKLSNLKTKD